MRPIDYFDRGLLLDPNQVALVSLGQSFTYRQLDEQSRRIAAAMSNRGLAGVPHVAILSRNHPLAVAALIGAFRAGAVWVPINPMNALETNIEVMRYADVEWLFYNSNCADQLPRIREAVPTLKQIVCLDRDDGAVKSLERFMATEGSGTVPEFPSDPNRLCTILPTGGTTGPSKAVMHTFLVWHTLFALGVCHWYTEERPVFLGVTPMTHAAGIFGYMHFFRGGTMVLDDGFDPRRWCEAVERYRVTHTFLPPTALYALLAYTDVRRFDYSSLRYFCIAAAPVSADKLKEAVDVFGPCMCEVFGQAEAPALLTALSPAEVAAAAAPGGNARLLSSCGRPTLLAKLAIMDDRGNLLPTGQPGEIVVRSFLNIPGYYKNPEATAELQAFGWHHTGDIGYFDDDKLPLHRRPQERHDHYRRLQRFFRRSRACGAFSRPVRIARWSALPTRNGASRGCGRGARPGQRANAEIVARSKSDGKRQGAENSRVLGCPAPHFSRKGGQESDSRKVLDGALAPSQLATYRGGHDEDG